MSGCISFETLGKAKWWAKNFHHMKDGDFKISMIWNYAVKRYLWWVEWTPQSEKNTLKNNVSYPGGIYAGYSWRES